MIIGNVAILLVCTYFIMEKPCLDIGYNTNVANKANRKYKVNELDNGITQFRSDKALIYSKKIPTFYSAEHSPYICWKGSGYTFTSVEEKTVAGALIYYGTLQKGKEQLQTAWWFSNKKHNTIGQLDWRWRVLCGKPNFQLINVTATSQANLQEAIEEWL